MKKTLFFCLTLFACLLIWGCGGIGNKMETIKAEQARQLMDGSQPYILLDVRRREEYDEGHIKGAKLIPDFELEQRAPQDLPDKHALIIVYCRTGRRSLAAAKFLAGQGYTQVKNMGGILNWPYGITKY